MSRPETCATLIALLEMRAAETGGQAAFTFEGVPLRYDELWLDINNVAAHLQAHGVGPGDHVIVVVPNSAEFFAAFYGVQRAGGVAVPLFPGFGPARILSFAKSCDARAAIVPSGTPAEQLAQFRALAADRNLTVTTCAASDDGGGDATFPPVSADDVAFVQYTSGSTGAPKGVQISHANLLTNLRQMIAGMQITGKDIFVSWLPVYHDMGLILKTMVPFYLGLELHLLHTDLQDVSRWLDTIARTRATFTAAPDFAYRLALRRTPDPGAHDLSSLRVALNAAEPVRLSTIREFERAFSLKNIMVAAYGLAEATVGVSMWPPNTPAKADAHGNVSVGIPFPDVAIAIVEGDAEVAPGEVGEIAIRSTALPRGYLNNPTANAALFWRPGWVLSGDLGYVDADGDLYVVGRRKNLIIQSGRNLYPQEIEGIVDRVPGIRYSVAVGIDRQRLEGEQVYVFAEVQKPAEKSPADFEAIVVACVRAIHDDLGFRPGRVFLLAPKTIPMTYNGKFQHAEIRQMYLSGALAPGILFPPV